MNYLRSYRKCAFAGRLLFDADRPIEELRPGGERLWFQSEAAKRAFHGNWSAEELVAGFLDWHLGAPPSPSPDIDPISLEVVWTVLQSIIGQMAETMARTAYSPVFAEARDFTCALFDDKVELIAQMQGLPAQVGSMRYCVPWAIQAVGAETLAPGDVLVHNDPQVGVPHLPEICVIRPIFAEGHPGGPPVMYAATIAHQTDVGGKSPGSMPGDAREIFQEGLVIPPVKLFEQDREVPAVFKMLLANVRSPESLYGDIRAMCGSLVTAERLLAEVAAREGWDGLGRYGAEMKNYAERRFRAEIDKLPRGIFRGQAIVDDDGVVQEHFTIALTLAIGDSGIIADFRGSSPQARGPINCTYSVTCAATLNAILHLIGRDLPINEGLHRVIHVIAPPNTIVNVDHPGAYNAGQTETHNLLVEAFMSAMLEAAPHRVCAQAANTTCLVTGGAWHPDKRETYTFVTWDGAGWGAFDDKDGNSAVSRYCGTVGKNYPTEILETQFPWLIHKMELRTDSGGAGRFRGGLGMVRDYELKAPELEFGVNSNRGRFPPAGVKGGGSGKPTRYWVRRNGALVEPMQVGAGINSPDKFTGVRLTSGEGLIVETPGGGGWGEASERNRAAVEEDLKQGYISRKAAVEIYGLAPARADEIVARYHWQRPQRHPKGGGK
jgi:N-methylhydantoinase B